MYTSSQMTTIVIFVAIIIALAGAIVYVAMRSKTDKKPKEHDERDSAVKAKVVSSVSPPPRKPDVRKERVPTRVVTSFPSDAKKKGKDKVMSPVEAEYMQIMAWDSGAEELRVCEYCGAERRKILSTCPACGQTNCGKDDFDVL